MPPDPRFFQGLRHFNDEDFYEAHEVWEDLWKDITAPERTFYQGLVQAAVACHHYWRQSWSGMESLYQSALFHLKPHLPSRDGVDLARFLDDFRAWYAVASSDAGKSDPALGGVFPKMRVVPGAEGPEGIARGGP